MERRLRGEAKDEQNYRTLKSATQQKPNSSTSAGNIKKITKEK
jgi:hypothetical protein